MSSFNGVNDSILKDPSIVLAHKDAVNGVSSGSINVAPGTPGASEPGNALSKLLDSAIAKAAKETTPELESGSRSASPMGSIERKDSGNSNRKDPNLIYSIDFLMSLEKLPQIEEVKSSVVLPDRSFWRVKAKFQGNSNGKEYNQNYKNSHNKKEKNSNKKKDAFNNWERKNIFQKGTNIDELSNDKISELLDEPADEGEPEWDNVDINDNDLKIDMGQTVEDFEKWKTLMKLEERNRNGDAEEEELDTNEVDSFFSFVKPRNQSTKQPPSLRDSSSGFSTPVAAKSEIASKGSRFSSFFSASNSDSSPASTDRSSVPRANIGAPNHDFIPKTEQQTSSRLLPIISLKLNTPLSENQSPQDPLIPREGAKIPMPHNNDTFFMSLLNKKSVPSENTPTNPVLKNEQYSPSPSVASPNLQTVPLPSIQKNIPKNNMGTFQQYPPMSNSSMNRQPPPWAGQFQGQIPPNLPHMPHPQHMPHPPQGPHGPHFPPPPDAGKGQPNPSTGNVPPFMMYPPPPMGPNGANMLPPGFIPPPGMPMPPMNRAGPHPSARDQQYMNLPPGLNPPSGPVPAGQPSTNSKE